MESAMTHAANLPPISVTTTDFDRLRALAQASTLAAEFLAREIDRARLIEPEAAGDKLVTMNSRVRYRDDVTGQERTVTLVYPGEADIEAGRLSVLTPVGAALIGLSTGQSIEWVSPSGGVRSLTVVGVGAGGNALLEGERASAQRQRRELRQS
jgi:regulator of nucleoside diphosphate kinase